LKTTLNATFWEKQETILGGNVESEMSQRVKAIHRNLIISDQWIEPQSPWQKPAELNGVKYLKSHAQVRVDRAGTPDNL
jgi:hypothetical protein